MRIWLRKWCSSNATKCSTRQALPCWPKPTSCPKASCNCCGNASLAGAGIWPKVRHTMPLLAQKPVNKGLENRITGYRATNTGGAVAAVKKVLSAAAQKVCAPLTYDAVFLPQLKPWPGAQCAVGIMKHHVREQNVSSPQMVGVYEPPAVVEVGPHTWPLRHVGDRCLAHCSPHRYPQRGHHRVCLARAAHRTGTSLLSRSHGYVGFCYQWAVQRY